MPKSNLQFMFRHFVSVFAPQIIREIKQLLFAHARCISTDVHFRQIGSEPGLPDGIFSNQNIPIWASL
jgi:hypothetical protein